MSYTVRGKNQKNMGKSPAVSYVTPLIKRHLFQYYLCASRNLRYRKSHVPNIQKDEVSTTPDSSTMQNSLSDLETSGLRCAWAQVTKPAGTSPHPHWQASNSSCDNTQHRAAWLQRGGVVHFHSLITDPAPLGSQEANRVFSLLKVPLVKLTQVQKIKKLWKEYRPNTETCNSHEHSLSYSKSQDTRPNTE